MQIRIMKDESGEPVLHLEPTGSRDHQGMLQRLVHDFPEMVCGFGKHPDDGSILHLRIALTRRHEKAAKRIIEELEAKVARLERTSPELLARCRELIEILWQYEWSVVHPLKPKLIELLDATRKTVQEATSNRT